MKKIKLDSYEKSILKDFEAGKFKPVKNKTSLLKEHSLIAKQTLKKDKRINIRISSKDLQILQNKSSQSRFTIPNFNFKFNK